VLSTAGLSLEQAPPIGVPFRFFLTAPLFTLAAGLLLAWQGEALMASRWTPGALAGTHLIALGFLSQVMCGALFQMLPVLAGSPVPGAHCAGPAGQILLVIGTLSLCLSLLGLGSGGPAPWLWSGAVLLGLGLLAIAVPVAVALARARGAADTVAAMRLALAGLAATLALGLVLALAVPGTIRLADFAAWVDLHLAWGLLGWGGVLIIGVGLQVVPMFHVAPAYPRSLRLLLPRLALAGLVLAAAATLLGWPRLAPWGFGMAILALVVFAAVTLDRQHRRVRRRLDATLLHWWSAMASVLLAAGLWFAGARGEAVGVLVLIGVGVGLPSGMLLKIAPFLSWFHLQHRQVTLGRYDLRLPNMHSLLPETGGYLHLGLHLLALALLLVAAFGVPFAARAGGVALAASAAVLFGLLFRTALAYRRASAALAQSGPPASQAL
jgi:hypothetical protein